MKQNHKIIVGIIVAIIILWFMCVFGGPNPIIDLNQQLGNLACPASCWLSDGGDTPAGLCPPLYTKLSTADPGLIQFTTSACITNGGTAITTDYEVSCRDSLGRIDCDALEMDINNARFAYLCHTQGGDYRCQDNLAGCYCPGNVLLPLPNNCSRILTWESASSVWGKSCLGACDVGNCIDTAEGCICQDDSVTPCELMDTLSCQEGECPPGEFCGLNVPGTACACITQI